MSEEITYFGIVNPEYEELEWIETDDTHDFSGCRVPFPVVLFSPVVFKVQFIRVNTSRRQLVGWSGNSGFYQGMDTAGNLNNTYFNIENKVLNIRILHRPDVAEWDFGFTKRVVPYTVKPDFQEFSPYGIYTRYESYVRVYHLYSENGSHNYVPARLRATGEVGLYDTVTGIFYKSETEVPFIAGPVKNTVPVMGFAGTRDVTMSGDIVQCYPLPESKLVVRPQFEPTEIMPETGEKSPENPSTIEGKNQIYINVTGINLLVPNLFQNGEYHNKDYGNAEWINEKGNIKVNTNSFTGNIYSIPVAKIGIQAGDYVINGLPLLRGDQDSSRLRLIVFANDRNYSCADYDFPFNLTIKRDSVIRFELMILSGTSVQNYFCNLSLTKRTSNVKDFIAPEGNIYTVDLGAEYGGGYLDVERGKFVQTHQIYKCTGKEEWSAYKGDIKNITLPLSKLSLHNGSSQLAASCTHVATRFTPESSNDKIHFSLTGLMDNGSYGTLYFIQKDPIPFSNMESWKSFLSNENKKGTPVTIEYELFEPIEHDITPTIIKALPQGSFSGNKLNNIFADTNLPTEVTYKEPVVYFPVHKEAK